MPKEDIKEFIRKRPSFFWWTLANLLAAAFAVISWTTCLYVFNNPEIPRNYDLLRKLKRLPPITEFTPKECPDGDPANPKIAFTKFFPLKNKRLRIFNLAKKRDYLTNYKEPSALTYVEGNYVVSHVRPLTENDFFHPGLVLRAQASMETGETDEVAPYPVIIELLLPTAETPAENYFKAGDTISLARATHRAAVVCYTRLGTQEEPLVCLTVIPLSYDYYLSPKGDPLPLAPPDPLNLKASLPVMEENQPN